MHYRGAYIFLISLLSVGLTGCEEPKPESINILVAARDLPVNYEVVLEDVVIKPMSPEEIKAQGWNLDFTLLRSEDIVGHTLRKPMEAGQRFETTNFYPRNHAEVRIFMLLRARSPQLVDRVKNSLARMVIMTAEEKGCLEYSVEQGVQEPSIFLVTQQWQRKDDWEAHRLGRNHKEIFEGDIMPNVQTIIMQPSQVVE